MAQAQPDARLRSNQENAIGYIRLFLKGDNAEIGAPAQPEYGAWTEESRDIDTFFFFAQNLKTQIFGFKCRVECGAGLFFSVNFLNFPFPRNFLSAAAAAAATMDNVTCYTQRL